MPSVDLPFPHVEPEGLISAVEPSQIYPYSLSPTVVLIAGICIFVIGEPGAMASTLLTEHCSVLLCQRIYEQVV